MKLKKVSEAKIIKSINQVLDLSTNKDLDPNKLIKYFLNQILKDGYDPTCFYDHIINLGYSKAVSDFKLQLLAKEFLIKFKQI